MNFKKRVNGSWTDIPHYIHKTDTDILTTLPDVVYVNDTTVTVGLKGNMVQNGTPTLSNPVEVVGVGELETTGKHAGEYKIPISSANTTTPVYLGEVQTTRKIKKCVFTGGETFNKANSTTETGTYVFSIRYEAIGMEDIIDYDSPMPYISYPVFICSHFKMKTNTSFDTPYTAIKNGEIGANSVTNSPLTYNRYVIFASNQYTTTANFKSYLEQQYAAGTPVTVWYVLAEPETAVVNEPLMKIGNYADTVSDISIPTIAGANTLSIGTDLQPSEVTANYHGWHPVSNVHVYPDSSWMGSGTKD